MTMMDEINQPKSITIMPDAGFTYAMDHQGQWFSIPQRFKAHPNMDDLCIIECKLQRLAGFVHMDLHLTDPDFCWASFNHEALMLTKKLALVLGVLGVPIYFQEHFQSGRTPRKIQVNSSGKSSASDRMGSPVMHQNPEYSSN